MKKHDEEDRVSKDETTFEAVNKLENSSTEGGEEDTARVLDHKAERSLALKFDIRLMPVLAIMCKCLCSDEKKKLLANGTD